MIKLPLTVADNFELWTLLGQVRHAMHQARKKELRKFKISPMQSMVMYVILSLGDKATPSEIARWLFRETHSVSEFLKRMEKDRLIRKVKDLKKRNMFRVVLAEKGFKAHRDTKKLEPILTIMSCLSKEEHQQLKSTLEKLWYKTLDERGITRIPPCWPFDKDESST